MRAKKAQLAGDDKIKVPGYIVTYSDMVTLLLTFFVMLLSLSTTQDPELFNSGRDSFVKSIRGLGLGMLFGKDQSIEFQHAKTKYAVENPEQTKQKRNLDTNEERTRRVFEQVRQSMTTLPSKLTGEKYDFPVTGINFDTGSTAIGESAKQVLNDFCKKLLTESDTESMSLYVLGLAAEGPTDKQRWLLSALRAKAVSDYMSSVFGADKKPSIYSWGAGPGKLWTGPDSSMPKNSQILIAVLR